MGAPYSAPPLWPFFLVIAAMLVWGYLCGRVRKIVFGFFLLPLPYLVWAIYSPGVLNDMGAIVSFLYYSLLFMLPGYVVGLLFRRRKAKEVTSDSKKALSPSINFAQSFLLFTLYVAAITVSVQYYLRHSFPYGYALTAIVIVIADILYLLVVRMARHWRNRVTFS
jgi:hypothetical protein